MENPVTTPSENDVKMWNMLCHLTGIVGFLGPLVVWLVKKEEIPSVDVNGKEALNFEISVLIVYMAVVVLSMMPFIGGLFGYLIYLILLGNIGFCVYGAVQTNNGLDFKYPFNLRLIK